MIDFINFKQQFKTASGSKGTFRLVFPANLVIRREAGIHRGRVT